MASFTITAASGKFTANHTAFTCGFDLSNANVPASFWSDVDADGGNIRVRDGSSTRVPVDPVGFDKDGQRGWIWFRSDVLAASDNVFTVDTLGDGDTDFDMDDVWQDYAAVVLFDEKGADPVNRVTGSEITPLGITRSYFDLASTPVSGVAGEGQGCAWDGTHYYLFLTNAIQKYDAAGSLVASNSDPQGDFGTAETISNLSHMGDGCVTAAGKIWVGMVDDTTPKAYLVRFDASDLSYDGAFHDISAQSNDSAASVAEDSGLLYVAAFDEGSVFVFDESTGAHDSTITTGISEQQGVVVAGGYLWINNGTVGGGFRTSQVTMGGTNLGAVVTGSEEWQGVDFDTDTDEILACVDPPGGSNVEIRRYGRARYDLGGGGGVRLPVSGGHRMTVSVGADANRDTWTVGISYSPADNTQDAQFALSPAGTADTHRVAAAVDDGSHLAVWDASNGWLDVDPTYNPDLEPTMHRMHVVYVGTTERRIYSNGGSESTDSTITAKGGGGGAEMFFVVGDGVEGGSSSNWAGRLGFAYLT